MNGHNIRNGLGSINGSNGSVGDSLSSENLAVIQGGFSYIADSPKWNDEKPYYISGALSKEQEHMRTNLEYAAHTLALRNLRGHEHNLKMERNGFELVKYPPEVILSLDTEDEDRTQDYLEATALWLERRFQAEKVLCYAFRVCFTLAFLASAKRSADGLGSIV